MANWEALLASQLGPTADSATEKANAKAIRDLKRKIAALQPIPPAEDTDGYVLLDSDDEEIEGEDPDATKRAVLTTAEAARIGKEKKKAATALHAHLGVKVIASLPRFNNLEMIRITENNDYNGLIGLIVNYWEVVHPLADD